MKSPHRTVLVLLAAGALTGCFKDPSNQPAPQDLIGSYALDVAGKSILVDDLGYKTVPLSVLKFEDAGVTAKSLPDAYIDGFGRGKGGFVDGSGKWSVERLDSGYGVTLEIVSGGSMPPGIYHGSSLRIRGSHAPYRIEMQVGDPDNNRWVTYEKVAANPSLQRTASGGC